MNAFSYYAPTTVEEALHLLGSVGARVLAGGSDLVPQMREGRRSVAHVVDLKRVPEFKAIERAADGAWCVGAAATIGDLGRNTAFAREHAALLEAARLIGSLQVQNRASLGGNICNAAPSADAVPMLVVLNAEAEIVSAAGRRLVAVADIGIAPGRTSLAPGEILAAIHVPPFQTGAGAKYLRFTPRREMDIAIAGAAAYLQIDKSGRIAEARVALASVAPVVLSAQSAGAVLRGQPVSAALIEKAAAAAAFDAKPISDSRASAEYRRDLVVTLTRRALREAAAQAGARLA